MFCCKKVGGNLDAPNITAFDTIQLWARHVSKSAGLQYEPPDYKTPIAVPHSGIVLAASTTAPSHALWECNLEGVHQELIRYKMTSTRSLSIDDSHHRNAHYRRTRGIDSALRYTSEIESRMQPQRARRFIPVCAIVKLNHRDSVWRGQSDSLVTSTCHLLITTLKVMTPAEYHKPWILH